MTEADRRRDQEALDWVRRIHDPGFVEWESHIAWLEADARNGAAFDRMFALVELATADLGPSAQRPQRPVNDNAEMMFVGEPIGDRRPRRWWGAAGLGLAAGVAGLLVAPQFGQPGLVLRTIATPPGRPRDVVLPDGTRIALNGGSMLRYPSGRPRDVTLDRGEAYFQVIHDPARPFLVHAGGGMVRDVGTAFNLRLDRGAAEVSVRAGVVLAGADARPVRLAAGEAARIDDAGAATRLPDTDAANVGDWHRGRLAFRDAPLERVAATLARNIGAPVTLDPALAGRHFTGVLMLDSDQDRLMGRLMAATDLSAVRDGAGWRLSPHGR